MSFLTGTEIRQLHLQLLYDRQENWISVLHVYISTNKLKTRNTPQNCDSKIFGCLDINILGGPLANPFKVHKYFYMTSRNSDKPYHSLLGLWVQLLLDTKTGPYQHFWIFFLVARVSVEGKASGTGSIKSNCQYKLSRLQRSAAARVRHFCSLASDLLGWAVKPHLGRVKTLSECHGMRHYVTPKIRLNCLMVLSSQENLYRAEVTRKREPPNAQKETCRICSCVHHPRLLCSWFNYCVNQIL